MVSAKRRKPALDPIPEQWHRNGVCKTVVLCDEHEERRGPGCDAHSSLGDSLLVSALLRTSCMLAAPVPLIEDLSLDRTVRDQHCVCVCARVNWCTRVLGMCAHSWQREGAHG